MEVRQSPTETTHNHIHRRKSSSDEDHNLANGDQSQTELQSNGHHKSLTPPPTHASQTRPSALDPPPSAGPYRTSYSALQPRPGPLSPSSPFRSTSFGHARSHSRGGGSVSSFAPSLSPGFSGQHVRTTSTGNIGNGNGTVDSLLPTSTAPSFAHTHTHTHTQNNDSLSVPALNGSSQPQDTPIANNNTHTRRHSRLHSRNLSIFFPRPGSVSEASIAEDGAQEIQVDYTSSPLAVAVGDIPEPTPDHQEILKGFTFGGRPGSGKTTTTSSSPLTPNSAGLEPGLGSGTGSTSRRGHHHKHSLSHQFFSFLEPGASGEQLHTQPTPIPVSPWNPISPFPESAGKGRKGLTPGNGHANAHAHTHSHSSLSSSLSSSSLSQPPQLQTKIFHYAPTPTSHVSPLHTPLSLLQFLLGAWLWISGQQIGSLACTGLGYWVVFDAVGVWIAGGVRGLVGRDTGVGGEKVEGKEKKGASVRRPFGNARIETVAMFAQCVYLMFSSVYVCKETVEHLLLSAGSGEGHHHHHGDEEPTTLGIEFPIFLVFITLLSLVFTAVFFNNHAKLVSTTGNQIPPLRALIRDTLSRYPSSTSVNRNFHHPPTSPLEMILTNPFILAPVSFCLAILLAAAFLPLLHYRMFDLVLAAFETVVTFNVAYRASVVLGTVLLQTSPERGLSGGRMEAFLRAMKEVERHPQVLHLPAPHIWQLTPSLLDTPSSNSFNSATSPSRPWPHSSTGVAQSLVVTIELHVRPNLADDDVLELTKWAWERCVSALHFGTGRGAGGGKAEAEVTVGVVRG